MNTPSPLVPQGTFPEARGRSHVRIAVFTILGIHVVVLSALMIAGCKKDDKGLTNLPIDTNFPPLENIVRDTSPPAVVTTPTGVPPIGTPPPQPIGVAPTPVEPAPPGGTSEYVVLKGDSFYTIAKKLGVTTKAMESANPTVDAKKLKIGQKLQVPAKTALPTAATPGTTAPSNGTGMIYVVKSGDTLGKIAAAHGTTTKALKAANDLKTDQIKVGQKLKLPAKETAPGTPAPPVAGATGAPSL
jgi:LysM repeat protein